MLTVQTILSRRLQAPFDMSIRGQVSICGQGGTTLVPDTNNGRNRDVHMGNVFGAAVDKFYDIVQVADHHRRRRSRLRRRAEGDEDGSWPVRLADISQNVGKITMKTYGKVMAAAIGLEEPEKYTGHCWRRIAATLRRASQNFEVSNPSTIYVLRRTFYRFASRCKHHG
jgi:hypothetical protein